jgi:hypothetical protein
VPENRKGSDQKDLKINFWTDENHY